MQTRTDWEAILRNALSAADRTDAASSACDRLQRALADAGAYDVRIVRNVLAREHGLPEAVAGRVLDRDGAEHEFEARRPPFDRTFRWVPG